MRLWLGILLILSGLLLVFISLLRGTEMAYGGMILIGPIPVVFGSSPALTVLSMILAITLMILWVMIFGKGGR
jgi:uncharacterized protein (TIGR00304 family)